MNNEVPSLINIALRKLQTEEHNFKTMETLLQAVTVVGTRILAAVPANWKEFNGRPWRIDDDEADGGTRISLAVAADRGDILPLIGNLEDGGPLALLLSEPNDEGAANIEVWPLPDGLSLFGDGEYRITVPYYRILPALVNPTDTNWFTTNAEEYLVSWATSEAFAIDWDEERVVFWAQKAATDKAAAIAADNRIRVAGMTNWVPHWKGVREHKLDL